MIRLEFPTRAKWIAGAYIKVGKFGEDETDIVYHDDVHGSLIEQAEKTLDLIYFKYLKAKIRYENGLHRVEKFPFPREALRELILNALVHKDYSSDIPIQISVSDDKLYIANVGSLPDDWTVKRLLGKHSSRPHNPTIAGCVYLTGMIETWGRGIRKVFDECKRHGCPPPVYEVSAGDPGDIQVRIDAAPDAFADVPKKRQGENVSDGEMANDTVNVTVESECEKLLSLIRMQPGKRAEYYAIRMGKTRRTVMRYLSRMTEAVEFRGAPKTGGYYVKD